METSVKEDSSSTTVQTTTSTTPLNGKVQTSCLTYFCKYWFLSHYLQTSRNISALVWSYAMTLHLFSIY